MKTGCMGDAISENFALPKYFEILVYILDGPREYNIEKIWKVCSNGVTRSYKRREATKVYYTKNKNN